MNTRGIGQRLKRLEQRFVPPARKELRMQIDVVNSAGEIVDTLIYTIGGHPIEGRQPKVKTDQHARL